MNLHSAELMIDELEYIKNKDIKSNLYLKGIYKDNKEKKFNDFKFKEDKNFLLQNLEIGKNDKIKNLDLLKFNFNKQRKKINQNLKKLIIIII